MLNNTTSAYRLAAKIERLLNGGQMEQYSAANLIEWAHKFKKLPEGLVNAFIDKATLIFSDDWFEDDYAQKIIDEYLGRR